MAKSGASLKWGGFDKALDSAIHALAFERQKLLEAIGETLVSAAKQRFIDGVDPEGKKWEPSARAWEQGLGKGRHNGSFGKTLYDSGLLQASLDYAATLSHVLVGSNLKYALIHQEGGVIKPKKGQYLRFKTRAGNWVQVKEVRIPKRSYLGISKDDIVEVKALIADFLHGAFSTGL